MNAYLIQTASPASYYPDPGNPPLFYSVIDTGTLGTDTVLDILHPSDPTIPGDTLIGGWNQAGEQVAPLDLAKYEAIRPLGNEPPREIYDDDGNPVGTTKGGNATKQLKYHYFAGWKQRQLGDAGELYPASNAPFAIETRAWEFFGTWAGWGWRSEIIGGADSRDPSVRAIGIYSDQECKNYLYTTGAFVQGPSGWQVDENGDPLTVWYTETPAGRATPTPEPVHFAVLWASIQEGYVTLPADESAVVEYLYWSETQQNPPQVATHTAWIGNYFHLDPVSGMVHFDLQPNDDYDSVLPIGDFLTSEVIAIGFRLAVWRAAQTAGYALPEPVPANGWQDTGSVIVRPSGQLFEISDPDVAAALIPGEPIRLGLLETTFVQVWPGTLVLLQISPYIQAAIGDKVYTK